MVRDKNGYIDLKDYKLLNKNARGRKKKVWLEKDGQLFLFKSGGVNYEDWAEIIASEIGKQIGLNVAEYDFAIWNNEMGLITPNFLKKNELIISGDHIIEASSNIIEENSLNMNINSVHSVENIITAIDLYTDSTNTQEILQSLIELWCFDTLLIESDRNSTNWGLIKVKKDDNSAFFKLAPIYDCSTIAMLNNNISDYMNYLRFDGMFAKVIDSSKTSLVLTNEDAPDDFFGQFTKLCNLFPNEAERILEKFNNINLDEVIKRIEERINKDKNSADELITVPYEVYSWVNKVIKFRLNDMNMILSQTKKIVK